MQKDSAADLKVIQEWFETNRIRETGIIENVQKQPASTERDEMLEICKGNVEEFSDALIQLVESHTVLKRIRCCRYESGCYKYEKNPSNHSNFSSKCMMAVGNLSQKNIATTHSESHTVLKRIR